MSLATLRIRDLRCISAAELSFGPRLNLIHGTNGSGKTSLLEAAFLAGRGRSFRTRQTETLISRGKPALQVYAETRDPAHRIGFEYRREATYVARLDGHDVQGLAELPGVLFVEAIDPQVHRLVDGPPAERRSWLDWGVFHVEPQFLDAWFRFRRALRQRNAALKAGQGAHLWDEVLVPAAEQVAEARRNWFERVTPALQSTIVDLAGIPLEVSYYRGWGAGQTLEEALREALSRDRERGTTGPGPQKADIHLRVGGKAARETLSRGQQKLVASAMVLALMHQLRVEQASPPTLLLDDPAAELDAGRLLRLVELVSSLECQLIISSLESGNRAFGQPDRVFHVEHGVVRSA